MSQQNIGTSWSELIAVAVVMSIIVFLFLA